MLARRSPTLLHRFPRRHLIPQSRPRFQSTNPHDPTKTPQSRLDRTISRLPHFLQRYITPIRHAPLSHVTSFLLLHEITAVVPLVGLVAFFHYTNWLPPYFAEGKWVHEGMDKFGRYFRRKGWFGFGRDKEAVVPMDAEREGGKRQLWWNRGQREDGGKGVGKRELWWNRGQGGMRILVEVATAWAVTKALLPLRIALSVWLTPWFARRLLAPVTSRFRRLFSRKG
ncbi:MAG: hypothetical protein M1821_005683 [Bathelium mastoideum]|nr:MAG: hypothetical protein M1821_005683 [Bathelium mastoideum]